MFSRFHHAGVHAPLFLAFFFKCNAPCPVYHSLGDRQVVEKKNKSQNVQKVIDIKYETKVDSKLFLHFFFQILFLFFLSITNR